MLDQRQERIAKGLEDARAAEEARQNAERERDKLLAQARADGQKVVEEARLRGEEQAKQIIRAAQRESEGVRSQARIQAEEERNRILSDTRDQIVSLAMAAAERVLAQAGLQRLYELAKNKDHGVCLLYTSPSPRDSWASRMPSSA